MPEKELLESAGLTPILQHAIIETLIKDLNSLFPNAKIPPTLMKPKMWADKLAKQNVREEDVVQNYIMSYFTSYIIDFLSLPVPYTALKDAPQDFALSALISDVIDGCIAAACGTTSGKKKRRLRENLLAQGVPPEIVLFFISIFFGNLILYYSPSLQNLHNVIGLVCVSCLPEPEQMVVITGVYFLFYLICVGVAYLFHGDE
jgi:hypothetical protein